MKQDQPERTKFPDIIEATGKRWVAGGEARTNCASRSGAQAPAGGRNGIPRPGSAGTAGWMPLRPRQQTAERLATKKSDLSGKVKTVPQAGW